VSASSAVPTKHLASKRAAGLWLLIAYEEPPGSGHDPHQRQPEEDDQDDEPDHLRPAHGHNVLLGATAVRAPGAVSCPVFVLTQMGGRVVRRYAATRRRRAHGG
jgi:hypothetical protein